MFSVSCKNCSSKLSFRFTKWLRTIPFVKSNLLNSSASIGSFRNTVINFPSIFVFEKLGCKSIKLINSSCCDVLSSKKPLLEINSSTLPENILIPLFSTILAILLFNEKFLFFHLIGSVLIILGLFLSNKKITNA